MQSYLKRTLQTVRSIPSFRRRDLLTARFIVSLSIVLVAAPSLPVYAQSHSSPRDQSPWLNDPFGSTPGTENHEALTKAARLIQIPVGMIWPHDKSGDPEYGLGGTKTIFRYGGSPYAGESCFSDYQHVQRNPEERVSIPETVNIQTGDIIIVNDDLGDYVDQEGGLDLGKLAPNYRRRGNRVHHNRVPILEPIPLEEAMNEIECPREFSISSTVKRILTAPRVGTKDLDEYENLRCELDQDRAEDLFAPDSDMNQNGVVTYEDRFIARESTTGSYKGRFWPTTKTTCLFAQYLSAQIAQHQICAAKGCQAQEIKTCFRGMCQEVGPDRYIPYLVYRPEAKHEKPSPLGGIYSSREGEGIDRTSISEQWGDPLDPNNKQFLYLDNSEEVRYTCDAAYSFKCIPALPTVAPRSQRPASPRTGESGTRVIRTPMGEHRSDGR